MMALGDLQDPYDLIIIGRGAAAADYLLTLPRRYRSLADDKPLPLTIMVIGEKDPWAEARGYVKGAYAQYVNQEKQVLQRRRGETAPTSQGPQDRLEFALENKDIIESLSEYNVKEGTVRRVSEVAKVLPTDRAKFKVESTAGTHYGHKIVFASGAGIEGDKGHQDYHAVPGEVTKAWPAGPPPGVMNLDRFIKLTETQSLAGKKVAVLGPTAGTDATMTALTVKVPPANLYWLMRGQASTKGFDNVYSGATPQEQQRMATVKKTAEHNIVAYVNDTLILGNGGLGKVKVSCKPTGSDANEPLQGLPVTKFEVEVDYFVYSIGQTAANTLSAPPEDAKAKASRILDGDLEKKLEPVYDVNQRLGSAPWEHVTAVQLEGSGSEDGLLIIGAATFQVASKMDHNFLQYEFDKLLTKLRQKPGFVVNAHAHFPELIDGLKFKEMSHPLSMEVCKAKEKLFLLAWGTHMKENLNRWVQQGLVSDGEKVKWSDSLLNEAAQLCYLYQQRCQAAAYLNAPKAQGRSVQGLLNPTEALPASLADCRLLTAVNANISALNASSPQHLQKKTVMDPLGVNRFHANFLEDKTELRCYIAAHYPHIEEPSAHWFINKVGEERKKLGNMGFDTFKLLDFESTLERMENNSKMSRRKF
jgi:hypothetical protein